MFKTTALDSAANRFVDEVGVTPGTRLEAVDHNIWMDELVNAVEGAGLTLDATGVNRDQLLEAMLILGMTTKNSIINGIGEINQRVTAYTLIKDAYCWDASDLYGPDRHEGMATGTLVTAGTFGVTATASVGVTGKAFKFTGVTLTGTGILYHRYRMEAKDAVKFKNQTASFSSKVYHDVGSAVDFTVYIRKANSADNFGAVTAISDSGAQSIATATPSNLKYESVAMGDCSNGIEIEIKIEAGAVTTKNIELTELQFELNSIATDFEYRAVGQELALCQRRFCKSHEQAVAPGTVDIDGSIEFYTSGVANSDHDVKVTAFFPVTMAKKPSVTIYDNIGNAGKVTMAAGDNLAATTSRIGESSFLCTGTNGAVAVIRQIVFHYTVAIEL